MGYLRTQRSPLGWILVLIRAAPLVAAMSNLADPRKALPASPVAGVRASLALCFGTLTIADECEALLRPVGPLALVHKPARSRTITDAGLEHSTLVEGWGIHYVPWRGWTYNLWGEALRTTGCERANAGHRVGRRGEPGSVHPVRT